MAEFTEWDTEVYYPGLLAPALIAVIAGLVIQSFIIVVNVNDWWKKRTLTPVDHIVTSLGIFRMCLPIAVILHIFVPDLSLKNHYFHVTMDITEMVYVFFYYLDIWLTSLLSIVFYLKISNIHTRLFLYLRRVIVQRTGYFIVASVLLSTFSSLVYLLLGITEVTKVETYNTTINNRHMDCTYNYLISLAVGAFIPLLSYCTSSVLLFTLLYLHISKMKMSSNLNINLETYYSAMKFVSFTFIYNTICFFGHLFTAFYFYFQCVALPQLDITLGFVPVLHSSYLIYRTAKFRSRVAKVLHYVIDLLFQSKATKTREQIQVVAQ